MQQKLHTLIDLAFPNGQLSNHLEVGGWNMVFVGTFFTIAIYAMVLAGNAETAWGRRVMIGFGLTLFGAAVRIGGWLPWRAFLFAEQTEMANQWRSYSEIWTSIGAMCAVVGLSIAVWPALVRLWGKGAVLAIAVSQFALFMLGVTATASLAWLWAG